jgi:hypothetical protein
LSYNKTQRAIAANERVRRVFSEQPMTVDIQQYLMVDIADESQETLKIPDGKKPAIERYLFPLRAAAQERLWAANDRRRP